MGEADVESPHSPSCNDSPCSPSSATRSGISNVELATTTRLEDLSDDLLVRVLLTAGGAESAACLAATSTRFAQLSKHRTLWSAHARHVLAVRRQLLHASQQPTHGCTEELLGE
jgi:hypothetical protein